MKIETTNRAENKIIGVEEFQRAVDAKKPIYEGSELVKREFAIFKVPIELLDALGEYLQEKEDDAEERDFDENGELKHYAEDETVSDFLKNFLYAEKKLTEYAVTVEVVVEADDEDSAREAVENDLRCMHSWEVTYVQEN